ncbi:MAG: outer membrane beta-barrel protein [Bacteroidetes bacterium]|nr:outer membrane beta-barrel protein [Bacteroidota bacterium]
MKRIILLVFILSTTNIQAQFDISTGMGISYFNAASMTDYINVNFAGANQLKSFNSSVEFFIEGDYEINPSFQVGLEYALSLYSFNSNGAIAYYDFSVNFHKPTLLAYYVIPGKGYKFKFGGGLGYRSAQVTEKIGTDREYSSSGVGLVLRAQGITALSENFFAMIGADARYDYNGEPKDGETYIINGLDDSYVNLNLISVAFKIGVVYFID